ncbi:MAG: hypothetical protein RIS47_809 [Bacteroidota bacterium]
MIRFLIFRPVAVVMTFIAVLVLGLATMGLLPVSLMPDIDIPEINVLINRPGESAQQIEQTIVQPLRYELNQTADLEQITSESKDGKAHIRLRFKYGAAIDYAYINTNEKVDLAMKNLPNNVERPAIIKASAADLPVFYINLWPAHADDQQFIEFSKLTQYILAKRIEQLPEVAMVDMTGQSTAELLVEPQELKLQSLGLSPQNLIAAIEQNNTSLGSVTVNDGHYRFSLRVANALKSAEDVQAITIGVGGRLIPLRELATVTLRSQDREGAFITHGQQGISLAIIKQSDARMEAVRTRVQEELARFAQEYPQVHSEMVRDQTSLLEYAITNLQSNLLIGGFLAFLVLFFFLKDPLSPWLIGFSVPLSLVVSFLFFYLCKLSLNIVSLSGLILGVGMMIDNAIIVIDNISFYLKQGQTLADACVKGTQQVITPLISSMLTTCAVFVPLVFINGMAGALFYDQALAITIGLTASLIVSITLIPVLFFVMRKNDRMYGKWANFLGRWLQKLNIFEAEEVYEQGFRWVFRHRRIVFLTAVLLLIPAVWLAWTLPKSQFPTFTQHDFELQIDWNERINFDENSRRVQQLENWAAQFESGVDCFVGTQNYLFHNALELEISQAHLYFAPQTKVPLAQLQSRLRTYILQNWPLAQLEIQSPKTVFEQIFDKEEPLLVLHLTLNAGNTIPPWERVQEITQLLNRKLSLATTTPQTETYLEISSLADRMALYHVSPEALQNRLQTALNAVNSGTLYTGREYLPIMVGFPAKSVRETLANLSVVNDQQVEVPLSALVQVRTLEDYKVLYGQKEGAFVPIYLETTPTKPEETIARLRQFFTQFPDIDLRLSGSYFSNQTLIVNLIVVLGISLLLLYFILAAQFESLLQPLILLLEIPIDLAGALFMLWLWGGSINLMSMIGIVVMGGIVVNDSILKVDTINMLRAEGMPLMQAIEEAGKRRLKAIIMTSLTTILSLVPVLWGEGMGSELQRPLALTVIGGMTLGTLVSLYFVPLCYYFIYRKK